MFLEKKMLGVYGANCYIVACDETKIAAVIDPGGEPEEVVKIVEENGLSIKHILLTHGHGDHIGGVNGLVEKYGAEVSIHSCDAELLLDPEKNLSAMMPGENVVIEKFGEVEDGDCLAVGNLSFKYIHTPGHTRGCVCIAVEDKLFTGDTLFKGSIGRTDLYGGGDDLLESVEKKILCLDENTIILPGHGGATVLKDERETNPFIRNLDRI